MPKFCVSLNFLFGEHDFLDRFAACKEAGFDSVEYMFPYEYEIGTLSELLRTNGLKQVLFNLPAGDWQAGERGIAGHPERVDEFRRGVDRAREFARALNVQRINCLAGQAVEGVSLQTQRQVLKENLTYAAEQLADDKILLCVEPVNTFDVPGFLLSRTHEVIELIDEVGAENLRLQIDVYHMQRMEGQLTETIRNHLDRIGHIQIADVPGRHQPGTGEINYRFLLDQLDDAGYEGFVGLEYFPQPDTLSSLQWLEEFNLTL